MSAIVEQASRELTEAQVREVWAWDDYLAATRWKLGDHYAVIEAEAWSQLQRRLQTIRRTRGAA
jgi:hypothetical protein